MTIDDVDFARLYREHMTAARARRPPEAWDARAERAGRGKGDEAYVEAFLARMDFTGCATLLDVGCGWGAVALAAAPRLETVWGLDYSPRMLEVLAANAKAAGLANVRPILRAWEDDWADVPECDLVVASRSTLVTDMEDALLRLNAKALRRVYMTSRVGGTFVDAAACAAIGREPPPAAPDYVYALNILHRMGIHARVDYIEAADRGARRRTPDERLRRLESDLGGLTEREREAFAAWVARQPDAPAPGDRPPLWAFLSWDSPR